MLAELSGQSSTQIDVCFGALVPSWSTRFLLLWSPHFVSKYLFKGTLQPTSEIVWDLLVVIYGMKRFFSGANRVPGIPLMQVSVNASQV